MEKKRNLKGRRERVTEDLTWREKRMRWKLQDIEKREKRKK